MTKGEDIQEGRLASLKFEVCIHVYVLVQGTFDMNGSVERPIRLQQITKKIFFFFDQPLENVTTPYRTLNFCDG